MKPIRTIKFVARQTGLSIHAIRVWERRYGAVQPVRAKNNRRLYSEADVERLRLLHAATAAGHAIGQIARAPLSRLQRLVGDASPIARDDRAKKNSGAIEDSMRNALSALIGFDSAVFLQVLERAAIDLGSPAVLQKFIAPLAERIGELWREGELTVAHEHFATNHLRDFLANFARPYAGNSTAPHLVLTTLTGQLHELGALIVAAAARSHGWRTTYLGASLPIEELIGAIETLRPRAVGVSIVFPPDDLALRRDLKKLGKLMPKQIPMLVGGRSAQAYAEILREIKAIQVKNLEALFPTLDKLQRKA